MNWFKKMFMSTPEDPAPVWKKILPFFASGKAALLVEKALGFVGKALPFIKIAGDIITSLTPTPADDLVWAGLKKKFPKLFDGDSHTAEEIKLMMMLYSSESLKAKYELSTTEAILINQMAYADYANLPQIIQEGIAKENEGGKL